MNAERWQRMQRLLDGARALPEAEREAYVRRESGEDAELAEETLRLLRIELEPTFLTPPEAEAPPVPRRLGDFELLEKLGQGRFGTVYRARQLSLGGRIVAVKALAPSFMLMQRDIDRFARESRAAARLHHPSIVQILTVGEEQGTLYFAMDLVPGPTLAEEIRRLHEEQSTDRDSGARLPSSRSSAYFRSVAELVRQIADGLAYAHEHGVVHRDIKPANLMLDAVGHALIVDFGLARDEEQGTITQTDMIAGTPHYMSPEQAAGHFHRVDERTDVYSLGVVLYELLTLRRPFEGRTTDEILRNIREREATRIERHNPRAPSDLKVICAAAMAKGLKERYSAAELRDELARFLAGEAIHRRPPSVLRIGARFVHRNRRALGGAAVVLLALTGGLLIAWRQAGARRLAALVETLEQVRDEGPLHDLALPRLLELRRVQKELGEHPLALSPEVRREVEDVGRDFEVLRVELTARGRKSLESSRDAGRPDGARELDRLSGLLTLLEASHLFPEDVELRELARVESAYPTVAVRALDENGNETAAEVYLREVDITTSAVGAKRLLGRAPLPPTPVPPGYYRIVVVFGAGGFRELICNPGPAFMNVALEARRRPDEDSLTRDMVRIESGSVVIREVQGLELYRGKPAQLDAFWIDATEVSNAEYRAFVLATGRAVPRFWKFVEDWEAFLQQYGDLPVVGASWGEAVAFAEWAGKHLPTAAEWHRASGGPDAWPLPYSADPAAPIAGNVSQPLDPKVGELARWQKYLSYAAPVRSHPGARTPEGLYHVYGNVYEFTESMALVPLDHEGTLVPHPFERFYYGGGWDAVAQQTPMYAPSFEWIGSDAIHERLGFRCAKSAAP